MRTQRSVAALPALLVLLGCLVECGRREGFTPPPGPMVGKPAPPFTFRSPQRRAFSSENFAGKVCLLLFARPGQVELPSLLRELEEMRRDPALASVEWVVLLPQDDPLVKPFWLGLGTRLPFVLDYSGVAERFGAGSLPLVVILDRQGVVRLRLDGFVGRDFLPRLEATHRILLDLVRARMAPSGSGR